MQKQNTIHNKIENIENSKPEIKNKNELNDKSKNNNSNNNLTNNSSSKEKEILDEIKDKERRLKILEQIEERRKIKELQSKREKERIRKALLGVTNIVVNKNGLNNLGNTCYMNTCLQLLIHCSPFIEKLFIEEPKEKLSKDFYNLCNSQLSNISKPIELKNEFANKHKSYIGYNQHDTQEFCRLFLEDISNEMNKVKIKPPYIELKDENKNKIQLNYEYDKIFKRREDSIVVDTFYGQIINIFQCKCGFETYSYEKFLDVPLLMKDKGKQKINHLLENFFKIDKIDWNVNCKECKKKKEHKKIVKIAYPPEILILSLQRYDIRMKKKNNCKIEFNENIDLKKFSDQDCCGNYSTKYNLIGIGNHIGSMDFGHYFAFINIQNQWYEFNDSSCNEINKLNHVSETAYILVYERE